MKDYSELLVDAERAEAGRAADVTKLKPITQLSLLAAAGKRVQLVQLTGHGTYPSQLDTLTQQGWDVLDAFWGPGVVMIRRTVKPVAKDDETARRNEWDHYENEPVYGVVMYAMIVLDSGSEQGKRTTHIEALEAKVSEMTKSLVDLDRTKRDLESARKNVSEYYTTIAQIRPMHDALRKHVGESVYDQIQNAQEIPF